MVEPFLIDVPLAMIKSILSVADTPARLPLHAP